MKVLFLGDSEAMGRLDLKGVCYRAPLTLEQIDTIDPDFIVSYGYRHILSEEIVDTFRGKIINLHISMLPWNRGADPVHWALKEKTPMGVTIHQIDAGVDTGDILAQVGLSFDESLSEDDIYHMHKTVIEDLFRRAWPAIKEGKLKARKQVGQGSFHKKADRESV